MPHGGQIGGDEMDGGHRHLRPSRWFFG